MNLQDHQAKTHNYGKGLAYLKNRATTSQNQTLHLQKMKKTNKQANKQTNKQNAQADNNLRQSNQKKEKKNREP